MPHEFEASSIAEIREKVTAFGNALGRSVGVWVNPKDRKARKIPGFDKARFSDMTFNLEEEPDDLHSRKAVR